MSTMTTKVVILHPAEPSEYEDLEALLTDVLYTYRVQYVKGSPMSFYSLKKVKVNYQPLD